MLVLIYLLSVYLETFFFQLYTAFKPPPPPPFISPPKAPDKLVYTHVQ